MLSPDEGCPKLLLPDDLGDQWRDEVLSKEYFSLGRVKTPDGRQYRVFFISLHRLTSELGDTVGKLNQNWFAEPGLIVLSDFSFEGMEAAIRELWAEGFFDALNPLV